MKIPTSGLWKMIIAGPGIGTQETVIVIGLETEIVAGIMPDPETPLRVPLRQNRARGRQIIREDHLLNMSGTFLFRPCFYVHSC